MELDFEWVRGFRIGLWYFDFSDWEDVDFNLAVVADFGFFGLRFWLHPKESYFQSDDDMY